MCTLVERIDLGADCLTITLCPFALAKALEVKSNAFKNAPMAIFTPLTVKKRGVEQRPILGDLNPEPTVGCMACLAKAHQWTIILKLGNSLAEIAANTGDDQNYIRKRICLASLSPQIQRAIISGKHPDAWTIGMFVRMALPLDWRTQDALLIGDHPHSLQRLLLCLLILCSAEEFPCL